MAPRCVDSFEMLSSVLDPRLRAEGPALTEDARVRVAVAVERFVCARQDCESDSHPFLFFDALALHRLRVFRTDRDARVVGRENSIDRLKLRSIASPSHEIVAGKLPVSRPALRGWFG